jgi:hypothetical protein
MGMLLRIAEGAVAVIGLIYLALNLLSIARWRKVGRRYTWVPVLVLLMVSALPSGTSAYLTDKNIYAEPAAPPTLAASGSLATDPIFGSTILRVTDSDDGSEWCIHHYSNQSPTNINSTYLKAACKTTGFSQDTRVWDFNAATMAMSNPRNFGNAPTSWQDYGIHWSHSYPDKFFGVGGNILYEVTIPPGSSTTWTVTAIHDFASDFGAPTPDNITQMSMSLDDDVFAFHYVRSDVSVGYAVYKRSTDTVLLFVDDEGEINEVEIDKSGRYLVALKTGAGGLHVWDLQGTPTRTTVTTDVFNHRAMGNGFVISSCQSNKLCRRDLATPNTTSVILTTGWSYSFKQDNIGMVGTDGWVYACRHNTDGSESNSAFEQECLEVATDGSENVRRHVHHWSKMSVNTYEHTPRGGRSYDGRFMGFTSNWNNFDSGNGRRDMYVVKLIEDAPPAAFTVSTRTIVVSWASHVAPVALSSIWQFRQALLCGLSVLWLTGCSMLATIAHIGKVATYKATLSTVTGASAVLGKLPRRS